MHIANTVLVLFFFYIIRTYLSAKNVKVLRDRSTVLRKKADISTRITPARCNAVLKLNADTYDRLKVFLRAYFEIYKYKNGTDAYAKSFTVFQNNRIAISYR